MAAALPFGTVDTCVTFDWYDVCSIIEFDNCLRDLQADSGNDIYTRRVGLILKPLLALVGGMPGYLHRTMKNAGPTRQGGYSLYALNIAR